MKTGIFETEHFEGAYPVIKLFDKNQHSLVIFTYEEPFRQFQHLFKEDLGKYTWIRKESTESKIRFIRKVYKETKKRKLELLYINGITDNFIFYALMILFLPKVRVILTIHVINSYFKHKWQFSLRRITRIIGRKILIASVKEFNVVSTTMIEPLKRHLPAQKKIHCLPGAVFEIRNENIKSVNDGLSLVIPGSIDGKRRNYHEAIELITELERNAIPVTLTLLGRFCGDYGNQVLERCNSLQLKTTKILHYGFDTVDQLEFDRVMESADIVFLPSVLKTIMQDDVEEIYGITVCSGSLFDVIKHAKPFIIPAALQIDPFLERSCFRYKSIQEVVDWIAALSHDPGTYQLLNQNALQSSRNYTIEAVTNRNKEVFAPAGAITLPSQA